MSTTPRLSLQGALVSLSSGLKSLDRTCKKFWTGCVRSWSLFGLSHGAVCIRTAGILAGLTATVASGQGWNVLDTTPTPVAVSALDFSVFNHAPAGKYGGVKIDSVGDLYFENAPGQKARFYGTNILLRLGAPSHAQADAIASRMAHLGYNTCRLHAIDYAETWFQGIYNLPTSTNPAQLSLNAAALDRVDYLIHALKQKGIYVQIDLMGFLSIRSVPGLSDYYASGSNKPLTTLMPFIPAARDLWLKAADLWLNHVNPYTGLALKDEPALIGVSPWNENLALNITNPSSAFAAELLSQFNAFRSAQGLPPIASFPSSYWGSEASTYRNSLLEFYATKTMDLFATIRTHLKDTVQLKAPLSGLNYLNSPAINYWRFQGPDVHETHAYYQKLQQPTAVAHAGGPYVYNPASQLRLSEVFDYATSTRKVESYPALALQQGWAKPFYLTEYRDMFPNPGRDESGIFVGAIGALQSWDAIHGFGWDGLSGDDATLDFKVGQNSEIEMASDPIALAATYQASYLYRVAGLERAPARITLVRDRTYCRTRAAAANATDGITNLLYLSYMYRVDNVYADVPGLTYPAIYLNLTPSEITQGMLTGSFPTAKKLNITSSSTLQQAAQACIDALEQGTPDEVAIANMQQMFLDAGRLASETGEMYFDLTNHRLIVDTPKAVAAAGTLGGTQSFQVGAVSLTTNQPKGTVSAFSLDGFPLTQSSRILVINTTEARGYGATTTTDPVTGNVTYTTPNANGPVTSTEPNQVLYAAGTFKFNTTRTPTSFKAYRLSPNGQRVGELPISVNGGEVTVTFNTWKGIAFEIAGSPDGKPFTPTGLSVAEAPVDGQVTLAWNLALGATGYNVKRATASTGTYTLLTPSPVTTNRFVDTGLTAGQTYYYIVSAANGYGSSLDSTALGVTVGTSLIVDNIGATTSGSWITSSSSSGYYGTNYLHDGNTGSTGGKKAKFTPTIPSSGSYDVYARWPAGSARASNVPVDIVHHFGTSTLTLNQQVNGSTWVRLGRFRFDAGTGGSVTLRNDQTNSFVIADAIRFVPLTEEIIVDNSDYLNVSTTGMWTTSVASPGFYGSNYFHDGNANGGKSVEYRPDITAAGVYQVFLRWPTGTNRATAAPLEIVHAGGTATVSVNQTVNAATWNLVGSYPFNLDSTVRVTLRNDGAGGFVIADAVKLVGPTAP